MARHSLAALIFYVAYMGLNKLIALKLLHSKGISFLFLSFKKCFVFYQDTTEATVLSAIEKTTVGICVTREMPGNDFSDVGIVIEGVVVIQDLDSVAIATAMLFGLFYSLNMKYPSQLRYTFEVIQKVIMELDVTQLSRKAQSFKTKLLQ